MNKRPKSFHIISLISIFIIAIILYILIFNGIYTVSLYPKGKPVLIIENEVLLEEKPFIIDNEQILLSYNIIKEYFDPYIFWDAAENKITITTYNKIVRLATESLTAMINTKPVEISFPVKYVTTQPYIPIRLLEDLYDLKVNVIRESNRVIIDKNLPNRKVGKAKTDETLVKLAPRRFSISVSNISKNQQLTVYSLKNGWYQVRTEDGLIGYIPEQKLEVVEMLENHKISPEQERLTPGRGKLNMVWDYIHNITPDKSNETAPQGLDIISPTWFSIIDGKGNIESKADISYVQWAHANNLAVWALVKNDFDPDITHEFLASSETRDKIIRQILMYAELFRLDGINIDFENIYLEDKNLLVQFVRELTPVLRKAGIVVSMDVTPKSTSPNWSMCYNRKELLTI